MFLMHLKSILLQDTNNIYFYPFVTNVHISVTFDFLTVRRNVIFYYSFSNININKNAIALRSFLLCLLFLKPNVAEVRLRLSFKINTYFKLCDFTEYISFILCKSAF